MLPCEFRLSSWKRSGLNLTSRSMCARAGRIVIEPIRQKTYDVNALIKGDHHRESARGCGFRHAAR